MTDIWKKISIITVANAIYVPPGVGHTVHKNRPTHGLVFNAKNSEKDYLFDDRRVLHTEEFELFYLPKGSSYKVKALNGQTTGCYAINFDTSEPFSDEPFSLSFREYEKVQKAFKSACTSWERREETAHLNVLRQLYSIIYYAILESEREYVSSDAKIKIAPAERLIAERFTDPALTVTALADASGVSGTYFRRLFYAVHGVMPKEYISFLREARAKELLLYESMPISEVALLSGYSDVCHFSREFKARAGVTPAKYRCNKKIE